MELKFFLEELIKNSGKEEIYVFSFAKDYGNYNVYCIHNKITGQTFRIEEVKLFSAYRCSIGGDGILRPEPEWISAIEMLNEFNYYMQLKQL